MSWEDADWDASSSEDENSADEDEGIKQLKREAEYEKNKPTKKSLAERKKEAEEAAKAKQAAIDEESRKQRRLQQEIRAKLGAGATEAQVNKALAEAAGTEDVAALFAVDDEDVEKIQQQPAVVTTCDVDLLDLIGEEEHAEFGTKLATKLGTMSTAVCVVSLVEALLRGVEPGLDATDYAKISKISNVLQNEKNKKLKESQKKSKKKKKEKPKLNTGTKSVAKGGFEDYMGDDGAGNYYDDYGDYGW